MTNLKYYVYLLSIFILGGVFLSYQKQLIGAMSEQSLDIRMLSQNLMAQAGDPPHTWCLYNNNCKRGGSVFCQDAGGTKYPIPGATVLVEPGSKPKTTDGSGNFGISICKKTAGDGGDKGCIPPADYRNHQDVQNVVFQKLPTGNLSSGVAYTQLKGPTVETTRTDGQYAKFWDFHFTNCSVVATPPPTPTPMPQSMACVELNPKTPTVAKGQAVAFICKANSPNAKKADYRVMQNNQPIATTSLNLVNNQATWNYALPTTTKPGNYIVECRVCSGTTCTAWGKTAPVQL